MENTGFRDHILILKFSLQKHELKHIFCNILLSCLIQEACVNCSFQKSKVHFKIHLIKTSELQNFTMDNYSDRTFINNKQCCKSWIQSKSLYKTTKIILSIIIIISFILILTRIIPFLEGLVFVLCLLLLTWL